MSLPNEDLVEDIPSSTLPVDPQEGLPVVPEKDLGTLDQPVSPHRLRPADQPVGPRGN